ncbi:MAG: 4Fe-4S dicluster domain-containing protein [Candidatus Omnitrophica bacterium]|nr:4Fe-4S dicluster domain-containing protein [Candidatus Omnitrophota bacterium]
MKKTVKKEALIALIENLMKDHEVVSPVETAGKGVFYRKIDKAKDVYLGPAFAVEPVKKFFLHPSEWICGCNKEEGTASPCPVPADDKKRVIFGVRPCEARGLVLLDKIFAPDDPAGYQDTSYIDNRSRSVIVGLACSVPDRTCFCVSLDGSPVETRGMDAVLFDMGDNFIVEILTEKGKSILGSLPGTIDAGSEKALEAAKEKTKKLVVKTVKAPDSLDASFKSDYWKKVSLSCLSCGVCTYLCPTCHCFDLVEEERKKLRCYDGCAFPDFTLETSGENPRPTKKERYRQRVFHKFDYFKKNFGENLCVGCGRCIRFCPVKIDISEVAAGAPIK